ncbi:MULTISPECIES: hypothetical protein [unclassified Rickettsia]|uniref:hypothetical protein n=1 Tax=unclassified Rickettsia TaxID=114295 RepID=UPI003132FF94
MHGSIKQQYVIPAQAGIQKINSHPEFISGSINEMLNQVQHDKKAWIPAYGRCCMATRIVIARRHLCRRGNQV